jgi:hypothetical protein
LGFVVGFEVNNSLQRLIKEQIVKNMSKFYQINRQKSVDFLCKTDEDVGIMGRVNDNRRRVNGSFMGVFYVIK